MTNTIMRVSLRFKAVCEEIVKRYQVSLPAATEMILNEASKGMRIGCLIRFEDEPDIKTIIKNVSRNLSVTQCNSPKISLENLKKNETKEKKETDLVTNESGNSNQQIGSSNQAVAPV